MTDSSQSGHSNEMNPVPGTGVSSKTFEKFLQLKKRREEQSHRSTTRRVETIKADLAGKIKQLFSNDDEIDALMQCNVDLVELGSKAETTRKRKPKASDFTECDGNTENCTSGGSNHVTPDVTSEWLNVKQHLNVNSHLSDETGGSEAPKSRLEQTINIAIAENEFELAEELSDRLANRDFATKVASAFDARKFIEKRKLEDAAKAAAKKKKLAWGFEHKRRWETKGNM